MRTGLKVKRARQDGEENIVPLINIVFLLLIFFMLTGHLAAPEPFDIEPPESAADSDSGERIATVLVSTDGRVAIGGEETDMAGLSAAVTAKLKAIPDLVLHLKADGGADAGEVVTVMEVLRAAGISKLTLLTAARLQ